jgi:cytochrome c-type biogenesis protein CcmH/NrfG
MIDQAVAELETAIQLDPGSAMIHGMLGDLYREKGDLSQAEAEFKEASRLDPDMGLAHHRLAVLYLQQGIRLDDALKSALKAVQLDPKPDFIATLAGAYYEKKMYSEAEREIKRAISMDSDNESYRSLLAEIRRKTQD